MFKKWNGSSWQDITTLKKWNGSAWQDISSLKKYNGSAWQDVYPVEKNLYNYGDQCNSITGGWGRIINLWTCYGNYYRDSYRYIDYNSDHMYIRTYMWNYNGSVATQNTIDISNYKKVNILYDIYVYETGGYDGGFIWGVCNGPLNRYYDGYNPPKELCNGYSYRAVTASKIQYGQDKKWYNDQVHTIDISDLSGLWYIFTVPYSWAWHSDYTIVKIKRVWLSN